MPPVAPKIPRERTLHGETVNDDWFYLRDRTYPATIPFLEAENAYTAEVMKPLEGLRQQLHGEMVPGRNSASNIPSTAGAISLRQRKKFCSTATALPKMVPKSTRCASVI
jgi:oligopeptidase B